MPSINDKSFLTSNVLKNIKHLGSSRLLWYSDKTIRVVATFVDVVSIKQGKQFF